MDTEVIDSIAAGVAKHLQQKPFLHLKEAAEYIGLTSGYLKDSYRKKGIRVRLVGGKLVFARTELDRYMMGDVSPEAAAVTEAITTRLQRKSATSTQQGKLLR